MRLGHFALCAAIAATCATPLAAQVVLWGQGANGGSFPAQQPAPTYPAPQPVQTYPAPQPAPTYPAPGAVVIQPAPSNQGVYVDPSRPAQANREDRRRGRDRAPDMARDLDAIIATAERYNAASAGLIADLKALSAKYRAEEAGRPAIEPPAPIVSYFEDSFADGEFQSNPRWQALAGEWRVDPQYGLRPANRGPRQVSVEDLLQVMVGGGRLDKGQSDGGAMIATTQNIANDFAMTATMTDHAANGAAHFIVHQGGDSWMGYRLELTSGPAAAARITRRGSRGERVLGEAALPGFGRPSQHTVGWVRSNDGQMSVTIDGVKVLAVADAAFQSGWKAFGFWEKGGDYSLRSVKVTQPVAQ